MQRCHTCRGRQRTIASSILLPRRGKRASSLPRHFPFTRVVRCRGSRLERRAKPEWSIAVGNLSAVALLFDLSNSLGAIAGRADTVTMERITKNRSIKEARVLGRGERNTTGTVGRCWRIEQRQNEVRSLPNLARRDSRLTAAIESLRPPPT